MHNMFFVTFFIIVVAIIVIDSPLPNFIRQINYDDLLDVNMIINQTDIYNSHATLYYKYSHDIGTQINYYENNSSNIINVFYDGIYDDNFIKKKVKIIKNVGISNNDDRPCNQKYASYNNFEHVKSDIKIFFPTNFSKNINIERNYDVRYHINHLMTYNMCKPIHNIDVEPCNPTFAEINSSFLCQPKYINVKSRHKYTYNCDDNIVTNKKQHKFMLRDVYTHLPINNNVAMEKSFIENEKFKLKNNVHLIKYMYIESIYKYNNPKHCTEYTRDQIKN